MDHRADLYVLPHPKGGWQVRRHAAAKAIRRVASYQEAPLGTRTHPHLLISS